MTDDNDSADARDRADDLLGTAREIAGNNRRALYLLGAGLLVAWWAGWIPESPLPSWWPVALVVVAASVAAGKYAAERVLELFPEDQGTLILDFENEEVYEVSEDKFAQTRVDGSLYQWSETARPVYEAVEYSPEANWALGNWKESFSDTEVREKPTPAAVEKMLNAYRENFEPELYEARLLKRQIRSVVRRIERERADAQDEILDEDRAPTIGDAPTITEVLRDEIPEDLHPRTGLSKPDDDGDTETVSIEDLADEIEIDKNGNGEKPTVGNSEAWDAIEDLDIERVSP